MARIDLLIALLIGCLLTDLSCGSEDAYTPHNGDIIFHTSRSSQSLAIQKATGSQYSHMGVVYLQSGRPMVYEAINTVRLTPLDEWIRRGEDGHFVVRRLRDSSRLLSSEASNRLMSVARTFEGRPYDLTFEWNDDRIYCSELVFKIYERALGIEIGEVQKLSEFQLDDPAVRAKLKERWGDNVPLNEPVISPAAMFASQKLITAYESDG